MALDVAYYASVFECDKIDVAEYPRIAEFIDLATCEVETAVLAAGGTVPLEGKALRFFTRCILDIARNMWADNPGKCTDVILSRYADCQKLLKDVKRGDCPIPANDPEDNVPSASCAVVELCRG